MKKTECNSNSKMKTRAELIHGSRNSAIRDYLPPTSDDMFDMLNGFKPGVSEFVDITKASKP